MTLYRVQNVMQQTSHLPRDQVVNTFHFDTTETGPSTGTAHALNGFVAAALGVVHGTQTNPLAAYLSNNVDRTIMPTVKAYQEVLPGSFSGAPVATDAWAGFPAALNTFDFPNEVACCLSFHGDYGSLPEETVDGSDTNTKRDRPRSRRRGRIFWGPLCSLSGSATPIRPSATLTADLLQAAKYLANPSVVPALAAVGARWVVSSRVPGAEAVSPVTVAWVDNEWDTQRRRGLRSTARTTVTVP